SFFFRAEDGIRDFHVTGVQTCALPIAGPPRPARGGGARVRLPGVARLELRHGPDDPRQRRRDRGGLAEPGRQSRPYAASSSRLGPSRAARAAASSWAAASAAASFCAAARASAAMLLS